MSMQDIGGQPFPHCNVCSSSRERLKVGLGDWTKPRNHPRLSEVRVFIRLAFIEIAVSEGAGRRIGRGIGILDGNGRPAVKTGLERITRPCRILVRKKGFASQVVREPVPYPIRAISQVGGSGMAIHRFHCQEPAFPIRQSVLDDRCDILSR